MTTAQAVKERPILFSSEMVRAIRARLKTQTRRPVKPQPSYIEWFEHQSGWIGSFGEDAGSATNPHRMVDCPFGRIGDRLWVKEGWAEIFKDVQECDRHLLDRRERSHVKDVLYREEFAHLAKDYHPWDWAGANTMPRWASRILLEVTGVKVERAHEITNEDVRAEGVPPEHIDKWRNFLHPNDIHGHAFGERWDAIYGKTFPWSSNPWVWCVSFKVLEPEP